MHAAMNSAFTKRGIAAFCGVTAVFALIALFVTAEYEKPGAGGSPQFVVTAPTLSPTGSHMPSISVVPSMRPSVAPSLSNIPSHQPSVIPSSLPSMSPTLSASPSSQPSSQPTTTTSPSSEPSLNPTMSTSPSSQPSDQPTLSTSPSTKPSLAPSVSTLPTVPTDSPSSEPSSVPTQPKETTTRIIIKSVSSNRNMVAVGAICFMLMASTACHLRRRKNNSNVSDLQYSNESDSVASISTGSVDEAAAGKLSTIRGKNNQMDDVDLEEGKGDPNSVYNKLVGGNVNIMAVVDMAEAIHVPKLFTRQKEKVSESHDKQSVVDSVEVTPKASKPVRIISRLSPMFSPMKEFSIKMKEQKRRSLATKNRKSRSMACLDLPSMILDSSVGSAAKKSDSTPKCDIKSEESYQARTDSEPLDTNALALRHSAESCSITSPYPAAMTMGGSLQFTYEEELLSSARHEDGFSFRDVYFDPENELYECHVPTGPLGISVDSTQLGLRVQQINPTSPLCSIVSAGDIIIGVDDVDVVGVESSIFWQLVSRRANQHGCCLVIMKI